VIWFGLLDGVGAEGGLKLCEYAVKQCFQTARFGRREFIGNGELGQIHECLADMLESSLEDGHGG